MTAVDEILWLLCEHARTRHELQAATGFSLGKLESALQRLKQRQQIQARRLELVGCRRGTRPGIMGRPKGAAVTYSLAGVR